MNCECRSVRGWLFGGRHLMREQRADWHGFDRTVMWNGHDGVICIRCGEHDFILASRARKWIAEFDLARAAGKVSPQAHSPQDDTLKGIDPQ